VGGRGWTRCQSHHLVAGVDQDFVKYLQQTGVHLDLSGNDGVGRGIADVSGLIGIFDIADVHSRFQQDMFAVGQLLVLGFD
jgi:hypothetical protein